jgi:adenylate cyclase
MAIEQEGVIRGLDAGADDYVRKPFDSLELVSRIRAALRVKALHDELRKTKAELSRYVSLATLEMVERSVTEQGMSMGRVEDVTILFSDIRGFTHIAEDKDPAEVFAMLNRSLSVQMDLILGHHGVIDKLNGDEIMAVFKGPDMADNALACGRAIVERLRQEAPPEVGWTGVGIGINSGTAFVGSVGSDVLKDFTVVGNTVNIAARLCGKAARLQVLFTEKTRQLLGKDGFRSNPLGEVPIRGVRRPLRVYELTPSPDGSEASS